MNFLSNLWYTIKAKRVPKLTDNKTKKLLSKKNQLDEKLVQSLNKKKLPNAKQLKYIGKILSSQEKIFIKILTLIICAGIIFIGINSYLNFTQITAKDGGKYTEGLVGEPLYINPILAQTNDVDLDICSLIFNGLMRYNPDSGLATDLAESYEISEDQKTYSFKLKENIYWHDGQKLDANDVLFTFDRIKDANAKSPLYFNFNGVTIEKIDDYNIRFCLQEPFAPFLESLTVGILPSHIWSNILVANTNLSEFNLKPIGTGPYKFKSFTKDNKTNQIKSFTLIKNEGYHLNNAHIEQITFKFYSSFDLAVEALNNKNIEGLSYLPKEKSDWLVNDRNLNLHSLNLPQYTALFFNVKQNDLFKDKKFKKIISHSINKDQIITEILNSQAQKIDGPILPGSLGYAEDYPKYPFDMEYAKNTLEELGWQLADYQAPAAPAAAESETATEEESDDSQPAEADSEAEDNQIADSTASESTDQPEVFPFKVRKKGTSYLEFDLTTVDNAVNVQIAELIQKELLQIGIKVNIKLYPADDFNREIIKPRNYQVLLYSEILGYDPDPYAFWHSSQSEHPGLNLSLFANRAADELLENARKITDEQKRIEYYTEFQKIIAEEVPAIFLFNPTYTYPQTKKIKGFNSHTIITPANRFSDINDWYIKTKRQF